MDAATKRFLSAVKALAAPINFHLLTAAKVLRKRGAWYEVLDIYRLSEHARMKIKAVRSTNLVNFRKPSKKMRKCLRGSS
jgi:hypothetical protein